jgi:transposase-like protein
MRLGEAQTWDVRRSVDTGCHLHPKCLVCPRELCIHEDVAARGNQQARLRRKAMELRAVALRQQGSSVPEIAGELGLAIRTVTRHLQTAAQEAADAAKANR